MVFISTLLIICAFLYNFPLECKAGFTMNAKSLKFDKVVQLQPKVMFLKKFNVFGKKSCCWALIFSISFVIIDIKQL